VWAGLQNHSQTMNGDHWWCSIGRYNMIYWCDHVLRWIQWDLHRPLCDNHVIMMSSYCLRIACLFPYHVCRQSRCCTHPVLLQAWKRWLMRNLHGKVCAHIFTVMLNLCSWYFYRRPRPMLCPLHPNIWAWCLSVPARPWKTNKFNA